MGSSDRRRPFQFGYRRTGEPRNVDAVWYVVEEGHELSLLTELPGALVVARTDPLAPDDEAEVIALQRRSADQLRAADEEDLISRLSSPLVAFSLQDVASISVADRNRHGDLDERVGGVGLCRCAIVSFPPDEAPCRRAVRLHIAGRDITRSCRGRT